MDRQRIENAMAKVQKYIDNLTVDSCVNRPGEVVGNNEKYFSWDNEKRNPLKHGLLFDWSYYNGVVMEGLYYIYEVDSKKGAGYLDYIREYFDLLITKDENDKYILDFEKAGYVDYHGADCYKTASLLAKLADEKESYRAVLDMLYGHLTDENYITSLGYNAPKERMESVHGYNYWHCWGRAPKYKIWLDGIYMLQPFLARYAKLIGDEKQLNLINGRLDWVAKNLLSPNGLYYHAGNSKDDVCEFFWTRAMGWYGMAMVDVMECLPAEYIDERKAALKIFVDGVLKYQHESGLWSNLANMPVTETNRLEVSGTSMICYTILKGVRNGWLDEVYREAAVKAFVGMTELKLDDTGLHDIYLRASADATNNYENTAFYMTDEGKGAGPFIMAYSEMLY